MKVKTDENGYITEWALWGDNGGIEVADPDDLQDFVECASGYCLVDGALIKDSEKDAAERLEKYKDALRVRRRDDCFEYINRGQPWYSLLTEKQITELTSWYEAWLNVTETLTIPEKPLWLD